MATASEDDALILETQIARTYTLRGKFERAREILAEMEPRLERAGAEPRVRAMLETGRCHCSGTHVPEAVTEEMKEQARAAYFRAYEMAKKERLDGLAVDALHMLAFVDTAPADQLKWGKAAFAIVETSDQPAAKRWAPALRNNMGYALHLLGRYGEALEEFRHAAVLYNKGSDEEAKRIARWMIAWTLRPMNRLDEALAEQLSLERDCEAANAPDIHVFEELELIYRAKGEEALAARYAERKNALSEKTSNES
jgi:tetratricopeptide (TPR) repeat protein